MGQVWQTKGKPQPSCISRHNGHKATDLGPQAATGPAEIKLEETTEVPCIYPTSRHPSNQFPQNNRSLEAARARAPIPGPPCAGPGPESCLGSIVEVTFFEPSTFQGNPCAQCAEFTSVVVNGVEACYRRIILDHCVGPLGGKKEEEEDGGGGDGVEKKEKVSLQSSAFRRSRDGIGW